MEAKVLQLSAHLATTPELSYVGSERRPKAVFVAISNRRYRDASEQKVDVATRIRWTAWGPDAENAAQYLGKGSHVNIIGRIDNNDFVDSNGAERYEFNFTVTEIEYLDTKAESEARRQGGAGS